MADRLPPITPETVTTLPLPPLPQVLARFIALAAAERPAMAALAALVAEDPAFTAQILSIATAPPYRRQTDAVSLEPIMAPLGLPLLRTLANCLAVQSLRRQADYRNHLDYPGFWCRSLRIAALARSLAEAAGYRNAEEAYLAGLLHDIGQLLTGSWLALCPPDSDPAAAPGGVDPATIGARLVESWQLPSFMSAAVQFHEFPAEQIAAADPLCRIVWAARCLGTAPDASPTTVSRVAGLLGLVTAAVSTALETSRRWAEDCAAGYGLQQQMRAAFLPGQAPPRAVRPAAERDNAELRLEELLGIQAVMHPLQQSLAAHASETEFVAALAAAARLLFGLHRPAILLPLEDRPLLAAVDDPGLPPLLSRLEIPLVPEQSLAAAALAAERPCSSFDSTAGPAALLDLQLARLLDSEGLLCIPMGRTAQAGVMVFGLTAGQYACQQRQLEWLGGFARAAAGSLASLRSRQQHEQRLAVEAGRRFEQKARKVVHEAVNPLGIINNYLQICVDKLGDSPAVRQELTILKEEISRVERIIRRLSDQPAQPAPAESVNVNTLIEGMLTLYGDSLFEARNIDVDLQLTAGLPPLLADRDSLKQILLNLWKNGAEAMVDGGSFRIATVLAGQGDGGGRVEIRLSDSGPGLPADVRKQLFQPLAPDRRPDSAGVGLSIVAALVARLGGEISCDSTPQGTTFTISIACAPRETV